MACCGQRRTDSINNSSQPVNEHGPVMLKYLERSPIMVRGSTTGRHYQFSGSSPVQVVDGRDAAALLRTGFFRRQ